MIETMTGQHKLIFGDGTKILGYMFDRKGTMQGSVEEKTQSAKKAQWRDSNVYTSAVAIEVQKSGSVFGFGSGNFCWSQADNGEIKKNGRRQF